MFLLKFSREKQFARSSCGSINRWLKRLELIVLFCVCPIPSAFVGHVTFTQKEMYTYSYLDFFFFTEDKIEADLTEAE